MAESAKDSNRTATDAIKSFSTAMWATFVKGPILTLGVLGDFLHMAGDTAKIGAIKVKSLRQQVKNRADTANKRTERNNDISDAKAKAEQATAETESIEKSTTITQKEADIQSRTTADQQQQRASHREETVTAIEKHKQSENNSLTNIQSTEERLAEKAQAICEKYEAIKTVTEQQYQAEEAALNHQQQIHDKKSAIQEKQHNAVNQQQLRSDKLALYKEAVQALIDIELKRANDVHQKDIRLAQSRFDIEKTTNSNAIHDAQSQAAIHQATTDVEQSERRMQVSSAQTASSSAFFKAANHQTKSNLSLRQQMGDSEQEIRRIASEMSLDTSLENQNALIEQFKAGTPERAIAEKVIADTASLEKHMNTTPPSGQPSMG